MLSPIAPPHPSDSKGITEMTKTFERAVVAENRNCDTGKTSCMFHSTFAICEIIGLKKWM